MTVIQAPFFQNQPTGQIIYTQPGTYTFTVPEDVFFLTAVCVGGGGAGAWGGNGREQSGGGGGGLRYINYLPVTPGEILTVSVGAGGLTPPQNTATAGNGAASNITRGANTLVEAGGGSGSVYANAATTGGAGGQGTAFGNGPFGGIIDGGNGGKGGDSDAAINGGGGGAGGYTGNGGEGLSPLFLPPAVAFGGFGGGTDATIGGGGGGIGLLGGSGQTTISNSQGIYGGTDGGLAGTSGNGGLYGGGGGGADGTTQPPTNGGGGAVRIVWGPDRIFPANRTTNIFTGSTLLYNTAFASTNATTNGSITIPSIANGDLYLFIVYENSTANRPVIPGFQIIQSDNGTFDNAACTRVLLKGKATPGSTVTIPNDATYNGFVASLIGFSNGTNFGQIVFQAGVANISFSSITNGYYIMLANHDGLTEAYDTYNLDADFTRTFPYLTANGAVTGRAAAIGVVEPVVQSGTITPSRPAVGPTVQTQGTQFCFLYIN